MAKLRALDGAVFAAAIVGSGLLALRLGMDANFDQLQYHLYLGWSLLAGRLEKDIAPAGLGSYFNPLLQVPSYLGLRYLPPRLFSFLLAAVQGTNAFLVYRLSRLVLRGVPREPLLSVLAGFVAACGPSAVSLLGTTFGDNLPSLLFLGALILLCRAADGEQDGSGRLLLAGLLGGLAAGLKLTYLAFALALAAGALVVARRRGVRPLLAFAAGGIAGTLVSGGYWGLKLWRRFHNPVFPFANRLFGSPYVEPRQLGDPVWAARGWMDLVTPPVDLALGRTGPDTGRLQEIAARDLRQLVFFLLLAALLAGLIRRRRPVDVPRAAAVVVTVWLAGYATWVSTFHYYRYFVAGELLAPAAILALLRFLPLRRLTPVWVALAGLLLLTARTASWGRLQWGDRPLRVQVPLSPAGPPAAVLVASAETSFVLPFFPERARFFGLIATTPMLDREIQRELARNPGPTYLLTRQGLAPPGLERFGLVPGEPCAVFKTQMRGRLLLCPLERRPG